MQNVQSWTSVGEEQLNQDWGLGSSVNLQNKRSENMLSNLSKNLIIYENSYKKQLKNNNHHNETSENIIRRKIKRKKFNFSNSENQQPNNNYNLSSNLIKDKPIKNQQQDVNEPKHKQRKNNLHENTNMSKLKKMFEIFKQFNSLNDSILPFKVNLNKISQKRILANIIFKEYSHNNYNNKQNQQPEKSSPQPVQTPTLNVQNLHLMKNSIQNDIVSIKNRVYSLSSKNQPFSFEKDQQIFSQKVRNNIFSRQKQTKAAYEKRGGSFSRKKRTFSYRKPQDRVSYKTIEQIHDNFNNKGQNYENSQFLRQISVNHEVRIRNDFTRNENFSDSKFFYNRRQVLLNELKSRGKNLRR